MTGISRRNFVKGASLVPLTLTAVGAKANTSSDSRYDFVIAGAGHNSLITAAYLAKGGFKVLVLEGRPTIGGGTKTAEVCLPGFKQDLCSSVHHLLQTNPLIRDNELNLREYGLEYLDPDPVMHIPFPDESSITVWHDEDRTYEEYARHSTKDAEAFKRLLAEWRDYRQARAAGKPVPMENIWRRRLAMSAYDLVHELFESDPVRTFHLAVGRFATVPEDNPNTGSLIFNLLSQQLNGRPIPKGGSGMLPETLARVIEDNHGVILTNKPVVRLVIEGGNCRGVECADGSEYRADKAVVSTVHVKHLVDMAPKSLWGDEFLHGIDTLKAEHAMFAFHYATSEPPKHPYHDGGTISPAEAAIMSDPQRTLQSKIEQATGEFKVDGMALQVVCPSIGDPTRAPEGHHTLKIIGNLPYDLPEGPKHWDNIKEQVADEVFAYYRKFTPNLTDDKILAKFLTSPLDIERWNPAMWRGSVHAFETNPAQIGDMRPVPGWSNYRMPIAGLYQTGQCTGPGGSVRGTPGRNAAGVILEDFGSSLAEVVAKKSRS